MRNHRRRSRLVRRLALALSVAAVAAPTAQAARGGISETEISNQQSQSEKSIRGERFPSPPWPDARHNSVSPQSGSENGVAAASGPDGFDWGDAGIGAGTLVAVALLGGGTLVAIRHTGRQATA
jgi:hypothetical protein